MLLKVSLKNEREYVYVSVHDLDAFFHASENDQIVYSDVNENQSICFKKDLSIIDIKLTLKIIRTAVGLTY